LYLQYWYRSYYEKCSVMVEILPVVDSGHKSEKAVEGMASVTGNPGHRAREAKRTRHLVCIDVENLAGKPCPTHLDVASAESIVRDLIPDLDQAQCVVACSHRAARTVAFAFPGALRRWRSGADGADLALMEEMSDLRVMKRFDRVTLFSGDGIFANTMAELAEAGVETTVVSWDDQLSRRLRIAAQHVVALVHPETTFGEAS
jgi:hypothetical protein